MGNFEFKIILSEVHKLCGQFTGSPSDVLLQSLLRVNSPISPPPARNCIDFEVSGFIKNIYIREIARMGLLKTAIFMLIKIKKPLLKKRFLL